MSTVRMRTNVKLAKLFYKYMDEHREQDHSADEQEKETEIKEERDEKVQENYESYPPYNFSWFVENKIAAMGLPQTVANLNYLVDVGINHLITLSPEKIPPILECEKKLKWTEIPIKEFGTPTLKQILKFIEICERAEMRGEVIGVHCRHGRGRTGTMLACYLVHFKDMAPERAVLTVRVQRPGSCETYEQEKMVCHYHDCVRGTIPKPDYRLVDDKLYFDFSMKYMYSDDEDNTQRQDGDEEKKDNYVEKKENDEKQDGDEKARKNKQKKEKKVRIAKEKKKSNAMVINHKIYF